MPAEKKRNTMSRQWELLKLIPTGTPGKTVRVFTQALSEKGFPVSKRTVERDLKELSINFGISCNDRGQPYGWYWHNDTAASIPGLTLAEALSVLAIEEYIRPLLPASILEVMNGKFQQARDLLETLQKENRIARWANKVKSVAPALPLKPPPLDANVFQTVQEAMLNDRALQIDYRAHLAAGPKTMVLHPLALVQRGPVTYLVAIANDYTDPYLYAVHRMSNAKEANTPFRRSPDFDLDEYLKTGALHFGQREPIELEALVTAGLAEYLTETPLSEDMVLETAGGRLRLNASVVDTWQLRWWIMAQGANIEILKPIALREAIAAKYAAGAKLYGQR